MGVIGQLQDSGLRTPPDQRAEPHARALPRSVRSRQTGRQAGRMEAGKAGQGRVGVPPPVSPTHSF